MKNTGKVIFWAGVFIIVVMGLIVSLDPGELCNLDPENLPKTIWSYPALCFTAWAFNPPLGIIIAAIGLLIHAETSRKTILKFIKRQGWS